MGGVVVTYKEGLVKIRFIVRGCNLSWDGGYGVGAAR